MANWAKQSLLASSLHWLRVILNRLLLGERGQFFCFWKVGSWHFMAVLLFFSLPPIERQIQGKKRYKRS